MIVFGTRLFGKVDAVPGLGHVATKFFHVNYVPLVPTASWLVIEESGNDWRGCEIPLSTKSVMVAWLRLGLFVAGTALTVLGLVQNGGVNVLDVVLGVAAFGGLIGTYFWKGLAKADVERAMQLARHAGVTDEGVEQLRQSYAARA